MKNRKNINNSEGLADLAGGLGFPLFTLFLIFRDNPLSTNLSFIGNGLGYRLPVLIWALSGALTYRALLSGLTQRLSLKLSRIQELTWPVMILSVAVPYLPARWPLLASFHILMSYAAFAVLNLTIFSVLMQGWMRRPQLFQRGLRVYVLILGVCGGLFMIFLSINSLLEMFYTAAMAWLLIYLKHQLPACDRE